MQVLLEGEDGDLSGVSDTRRVVLIPHPDAMRGEDEPVHGEVVGDVVVHAHPHQSPAVDQGELEENVLPAVLGTGGSGSPQSPPPDRRVVIGQHDLDVATTDLQEDETEAPVNKGGTEVEARGYGSSQSPCSPARQRRVDQSPNTPDKTDQIRVEAQGPGLSQSPCSPDRNGLRHRGLGLTSRPAPQYEQVPPQYHRK